MVDEKKEGGVREWERKRVLLREKDEGNGAQTWAAQRHYHKILSNKINLV